MSYYKILSCTDDRRYQIEGISDGKRREMHIRYADIVRLNETSIQIVESSCPATYSAVSSNLIFVEDCFGKLFPIETKLSKLRHQANILQALRQNNIIEVKLRNNAYIGIYEVVSISSSKAEIKNSITSTIIEITDDDIDITSLRVLEDGYALLKQDILVVMDQNGSFHKYDTIAAPIKYDSKLGHGNIINIISKESFTLEEISKELGTKVQDVKIALRNILPDGKNIGIGIDSSVISFRKNKQGLTNATDDNGVSITHSEFYRLLQYLKRPDTQSKSIIHWKFYVNKKYSSIQPPIYLDYQNNPFKKDIPYNHLDMDRFENLINWLIGRTPLIGEIETYSSYFHLLYWSEQISFVQKIIVMHHSGHYKLSKDVLENLIKYPKFVNINVLIFIHSILKLIKEQKLLTNFELYSIWRTYCPKKNKVKVGLTLQEYIGINLFCTCKGAVGFNVEDWWLPNTYAENKPIFHILDNGKITLHYYNTHFTQDISPSMEDAKKHRSFVVFREDSSDATSCFTNGMCPVLDAINSDMEYRKELYDMMPSSFTSEERDENVEIFSYNDCPLISVPSWRYIWAERHRDKCSLVNPPKIKSLFLWYNKNRKLKTPFFCEGRLAVDKYSNPELHRFAKVNFNWCNGNACFTDTYVLPTTTEIHPNKTQQYLEQSINIYVSAIYLGIFTSDDSKAKLEMQRFNSCLNWLNNAAPHFYCEHCDQILEISNAGQPINNAHTVTWFECQNNTCNNAHKQIYLSHCWNDHCRAIIDSRETTTCPNNKYICPSCGVCCGEKMFKYKRQAGISHGPTMHFELRKFYCRKCGKQMIRQGNTYYCDEHPEVITIAHK